MTKNWHSIIEVNSEVNNTVWEITLSDEISLEKETYYWLQRLSNGKHLYLLIRAPFCGRKTRFTWKLANSTASSRHTNWGDLNNFESFSVWYFFSLLLLCSPRDSLLVLTEEALMLSVWVPQLCILYAACNYCAIFIWRTTTDDM